MELHYVRTDALGSTCTCYSAGATSTIIILGARLHSPRPASEWVVGTGCCHQSVLPKVQKRCEHAHSPHGGAERSGHYSDHPSLAIWESSHSGATPPSLVCPRARDESKFAFSTGQWPWLVLTLFDNMPAREGRREKGHWWRTGRLPERHARSQILPLGITSRWAFIAFVRGGRMWQKHMLLYLLRGGQPFNSSQMRCDEAFSDRTKRPFAYDPS